MREIDTWVGGLVNGKRVEESLMVCSEIGVRGKDGISADEIHKCGAVEKENRGESSVCVGFDDIYYFVIKHKFVQGKDVRRGVSSDVGTVRRQEAIANVLETHG